MVLVGDDRQLAAIDAGGGFRALRLRLGASELTENRRQHQAWEREALDLVRSGLVEDAVAAYQAHDRVVAADSKPAATLALLQDWWIAWQQADHDSTQEVIVLAARRAEVDRLNSACQELLAARGRLGADRLQVEDRQLRVGDRVVCGSNAIAELGLANGSRGTITALDPHARILTLRLDGPNGREVVLPGSYLDGRGRNERNRRVDLAYATTGHRAQGLTRGRALVRFTPDAFEAFFNRYSGRKLAPVHKEWVKIACSTRRTLINCPPRHAKSTIFSAWFPIWLIAMNRDVQILIVSQTEKLAKKFANEISYHLSYNERLKGDFSNAIATRASNAGIPQDLAAAAA